MDHLSQYFFRDDIHITYCCISFTILATSALSTAVFSGPAVCWAVKGWIASCGCLSTVLLDCVMWMSVNGPAGLRHVDVCQRSCWIASCGCLSTVLLDCVMWMSVNGPAGLRRVDVCQRSCWIASCRCLSVVLLDCVMWMSVNGHAGLRHVDVCQRSCWTASY